INNTLTVNDISVNGGKGVWIYAETNTLVISNTINNNLIGVQTDYLTLNPKIVINDIHLNSQANLTNLVGAVYNAVSNYFGAGRRAFSQKKISTAGPFAVDPWLNGPVGNGGDYAIPPALISAVASNGLAGQVNLHWGPTSAIPDFNRYFIFRTQTSNAYSNLSDSDILTSIGAIGTTNYVDTPVAGGYYYYYVSVLDNNGNESWYSPQATVNYISNDAPVASFTGPGPWITNLLATFTSTSFAGSGSITNYLWRYGDGASLIGSNVAATHTYPSPLTNYVSLTVFNNLGQSNTASNQIIVYALYPLSGTMSGTIQNGVTINLSSGATQMVTNSSASSYFFVVSNDTYAIAPSKLGYRFQPPSRSVTIFNGGSTTNGFTSSDIYPILTFDNLHNQDKVIRDLSLNVTSDAPEILSTITYTISNLSPSNHFATNLVSDYGTPAIFDTTLHPDGPYFIRALAVDTVFGRPHTNALTNVFDNGLFKVLDKNLENLRAIAYDTIRHPSKKETLELYFYIKDNQKVKINLYSKLGRAVLSYGEKDYFHGHNRLTLNLPTTLPTGPYYAVFECKEFTKTVLFVVSQ
ncbi:MAG: PKD domain-containing protein, partial [Spirochaetia bacterium]|nr:PKD domain-containing protein [Spirochaetia bacterium]